MGLAFSRATPHYIFGLFVLFHFRAMMEHLLRHASGFAKVGFVHERQEREVDAVVESLGGFFYIVSAEFVRFTIQAEGGSRLLIDPVLEPVSLVTTSQHAHRIRPVSPGIAEYVHGVVASAQPIIGQGQVNQRVPVEMFSVFAKQGNNLLELSSFKSERYRAF